MTDDDERYAQLEASNRALRQQVADLERRNAQLEQFAYVISHDLKAPLRGLDKAVRWLEQDLGDDLADDVRENIGFVRSRADRLKRLVKGVLSYSLTAANVPDIRPVEADRVIAAVLDALPPGAAAVSTSGAPFPRVLADATELQRVVHNLVDNAICHSDKASPRVVVGVDGAAARDGQDRELWRFWVGDNGPGIPEHLHDRAFQLLGTLRSRDEKESAGVGLTRAKIIVERWGGAIGIDGAYADGALVWFTVPAAP